MLNTFIRARILASAMTFAALGAVSTNALAQASAPLPELRQTNGVEYVTGGIGHDQAIALRDAGSNWPLALGFFGLHEDYLADVHVDIVDAGGQPVLRAEATGPYMLVNLKPGKYHVRARYEDRVQQRDITIAQGAHEALSLTFGAQ
jgi:glutamate synthase domain-containing protein 2